MPNTWAVDMDTTFGPGATTMLLSCGPKLKFGSDDEQDMTKDGLAKWEAQVVIQYRDSFGRDQAEVLKFGLTAEQNPGEKLIPGTQIRIEGLEVGIMHGDAGKKTIWQRAKTLKAAPGEASKSKAGSTATATENAA